MSAVEPMPAEVPDLLVNGEAFEAIVLGVQARVVGASRWQVERAVVDELVRFQDARITSYLPILVERAAASRLRRLRPVVAGRAS